MRVIPAIDLLEGQVVRLKKGDYKEVTVYNENPVDEAQKFNDAGFSHIHVVDLDGAKEGNFANLEVIQSVIEETGLSVQSGGGIRSYEDGKKLLEAGVQQIICSSLAVKKPKEWQQLISDFKERVILGMDLKDGKVAYGGWLETSDQTIADFLEPMMESGLRYVLSTDIARDGMLSGPNLELYKKLQHDFPELNIIASGGVSNAGDLQNLNELDLYGVVVGRAYYENKLTLDEMISHHSPI